MLRNRRKKILKFAKGFKGCSLTFIPYSKWPSNESSCLFICWSPRRKQDFKKLWICRVNAAARNEGLNYSRLRNSKKSSIGLNLKMLAQLSVLDKKLFQQYSEAYKNLTQLNKFI